MSEEADHHPHDKLFKAGFSDPVTAAAFLQSQLPPAVTAAIDWERLTLQPGSFVDSHFRHSESDLLFSAPLLGNDSLIHLLFEHQLQQDRHLALRLLRYMVRIWEARLKSHPAAPLPVILPVVLAQNARAWNIVPTLKALLDIPGELGHDLRPFVPDFLFHLIQLAEIPFESIAGTPSGILILRTMKAERSGTLLSDPVWDEPLLSGIPHTIFEQILRYMLNAEVDPEAFRSRVSAISQPDLQSTAMTLAQQLRQEGRQEGRKEGRQAAILKILEIRFGNVPAGLADAIRQVPDESHLDALQKSSIEAFTLEDFAAGI